MINLFVANGPHLIRVRTEARFTASDPWNQNRPTPFTIESYARVPAIVKTLPPNPETNGLYRAKLLLYSLRSEIDGRERYLPDSLNELWRHKKVSEATLIRLLKEAEPNRRKDDHIALPRGRGRSILVGICWAGCILLSLSVFGLMADQPYSIMIPAGLAVFLVPWLLLELFFFRPLRRQTQQDQWFLERIGA